VTSINGLLRIYRSRGFIRFFWVLVTILSLALLIWQIAKLLVVYTSKPTVSQVSFLLPENGLQFPAITICSHNPVRKEYVKRKFWFFTNSAFKLQILFFNSDF